MTNAKTISSAVLVAIAAWEGDIDRERAHAVLDGKLVIEDDEVEVLPAPVPAH